MKKTSIIKNNREFEEIINIKNFYRNPLFTIYIRKNNFHSNRFGISVPKKIGNAVLRNKIKRQTKDIIDKMNIHFNNSFDMIIIMKKEVIEKSYFEMKTALEDVFIKIKTERDDVISEKV